MTPNEAIWTMAAAGVALVLSIYILATIWRTVKPQHLCRKCKGRGRLSTRTSYGFTWRECPACKGHCIV